MNRWIIRNLAVAALVACPAIALGADQAPDVKGKWIGKTHTIIVGKGGHWPKGRGTWDKPALLEGQLDDNDTLSFCYMHTGGKSRSTVVSCTEVKRTR